MMFYSKILVGFSLVISSLGYSQSILNVASPEEIRELRKEHKVSVGDSLVSAKRKPLEYGDRKSVV